MSVASLWVLGAWIIDMSTRHVTKEPVVRAHKYTLFLITSLFLVHVLGLLWTADFEYSMRDLNAKLPLILFPVVIYTMTPMNRKWWHFVRWSFLSATFIAAGCLLLEYFLFQDSSVSSREMSGFISHVRFGLMLAFAFAMTVHGLRSKGLSPYLAVLLNVVYLAYLVVAQNLTGLLLVCGVLAYTLFSLKSASNKWYRPFKYAGGVFFVAFAMWSGYAVNRHYGFTKATLECEGTTAFENHEYYEGGRKVYANLDEFDLAKAWNERSDLDYFQVTKTGENLASTLLRYMSSRDLCKNATGLAAMTDDEIRAVENGQTSIHRTDAVGRRFEQLFFEIDTYRSKGDPNGKPFIQRMEYWRAAWGIIKRYPLFGVGTGDVKQAFEAEYIKNGTKLLPQYRLRAHNQYLTFFVAFGFGGLILLIVCLTQCWIHRKWISGYLATVFLMILVFSFFTEDTLETQAGVTFASFWISWMFLRPKVPSTT